MIVGMLPSDGSFKEGVKNSDGSKKMVGEGDEAKQEQKERQDYCRFIAVGTEMVANFNNRLLNKK